MKSHWQFVDVVISRNGQHKETVTEPPQFYRHVLDELLPGGSIVLRSGSDYCLDLVEFGQRQPWTEPMPWHEFIEELRPAQVA